MNYVFATQDSERPLSPQELAYEANAIYSNGYEPLSEWDFEGEGSRISGDLCDCAGDGTFLLTPVYSPSNLEGGKRYMQCMKCGCWSHL